MKEPKLNTKLKCEECGEEFGSVCMLSPDWSALEQFRNAARYHFETKHCMKKQEDPKVIPLEDSHCVQVGKMDTVYEQGPQRIGSDYNLKQEPYFIMEYRLPKVIDSPAVTRGSGPFPPRCCCCRC